LPAAVAELSVLVEPPAVLGAVRGERARERTAGVDAGEAQRGRDLGRDISVRGRAIAELAVEVLPPAVGGAAAQETAGGHRARGDVGGEAGQTHDDDRRRAVRGRAVAELTEGVAAPAPDLAGAQAAAVRCAGGELRECPLDPGRPDAVHPGTVADLSL